MYLKSILSGKLLILFFTMSVFWGCGDNSTEPETEVTKIAGKVTNAGSGAAIAGAAINDGTNVIATSGQDGNYSVEINAGTYTFTCTASGYIDKKAENIVVEDKKTTTINFALDPINIVEITSNITSNTTWKKENVYIIKGYIYVNDAILTIEAGTTVQFASDAALIIQTAGGLIADGTTGQITFTGQTKQNGFWRYIEFQDAAANLNCKMINCLVEYGGGYGDNASILYIYNNPTISNCTFRYSSSNGVEIDDDARPVFNNNAITQNIKSPVKADFESAASIGYGDYSGNGQEYIDLSSGTLTYDATLKKQNVPYSFSGYDYINNATLTIEAGTNILMNTDAAIIIGENGGFVAQGASSDSIVISSRVAQKGYWRYIEFQDNSVSAECKLDYCVLEYGGGYSATSSMFDIYNNATVTNSTFRSSSSNGVYIDDNARPTFTNNTITLNDLSPINGDFESAASIGYGNYSGNTHDYINLSSGTISETGTLKKQDVPYRFNGYNYINNATLTIEAGTIIQMNSDAAIIVDVNGGFIADGSSETITFTGYVQQKGYWRYIEFQDDAVAANCILNYCLIEYGGGYSSSSSIVWIDNNATVTNCTIQHSSSWGLSYDDLCSPTLSGNTYVDNDAGDVKTH